MTKEELVSKLTAAVGDTPYGKELIEEAEKTFGDSEHKYGWDMKDRLDLRLAILKARPSRLTSGYPESLCPDRQDIRKRGPRDRG